MDGRTTLRYVRGRHLTGDSDRGRRQQQVMVALARRFKELDWLPRLPGFWLAFGELTETDLSLPEIHGTGLAENRTASRAGAWAQCSTTPWHGATSPQRGRRWYYWQSGSGSMRGSMGCSMLRRTLASGLGAEICPSRWAR